MSHVTKNYNTDGGDRTVIGGVLEIDGGKVIKDGQEVTFGGEGSSTHVTHEMLEDKSVRSNNIGTGSVMEEHLNSIILNRFSDIEARLKAIEGSSSTE
jgi:hypothetical protein